MRYFLAALLFLFANIPAFAQGYDEMRKRLLNQGWIPAPQTEETDCFERDEVPDCQKYPEIRNCNDANGGQCHMQWLWPESEIRINIHTIGDPKVMLQP
jgi:hypothetical protein